MGNRLLITYEGVDLSCFDDEDYCNGTVGADFRILNGNYIFVNQRPDRCHGFFSAACSSLNQSCNGFFCSENTTQGGSTQYFFNGLGPDENPDDFDFLEWDLEAYGLPGYITDTFLDNFRRFYYYDCDGQFFTDAGSGISPLPTNLYCTDEGVSLSIECVGSGSASFCFNAPLKRPDYSISCGGLGG